MTHFSHEERNKWWTAVQKRGDICFQQRQRRNKAAPPTTELIELTDMKGSDPCFYKTGQSGSLSDTHQHAEPLSLCELITGGLVLHWANLTPGLEGRGAVTPRCVQSLSEDCCVGPSD